MREDRVRQRVQEAVVQRGDFVERESEDDDAQKAEAEAAIARWNEGNQGEAVTTIEGGTFSMSAAMTAPFDALNNNRTIYFYVDADDDGACTEADYVHSAWLAGLGTDFSEPEFVLETTPEAVSALGLCNQF